MVFFDERPDLILNIRKPIGWSSNDVIRFIKHRLPGLKVGHAGTLDPFAEGVLLVCIGKATKKVAELMNAEKEYRAYIRLGIETDSLDLPGRIVKTSDVPKLTEKKLQKIKEIFTGVIEQTPPAFSALKYDGKRAYNVARKGGQVNLKTRKINLYDLDICILRENYLSLRIVCSKGTYVRALARDISYYLGTVGYVQKLTRLRIGSYFLKSSVEINVIYDFLSNKTSNWK